MFKSEYNFENYRITTAKSNKNVRLHFLDIRDFLNILEIKDIIGDIVKYLKELEIKKILDLALIFYMTIMFVEH